PLWYFISWFMAFIIILVMCVILLIRITPLRQYVVGDDTYNRIELVNAYNKIDSLSAIATMNDAYLKNLQNVFDGSIGETEGDVMQRDLEQVNKLKQITPPVEVDVSEDESILLDLLTSDVSVNTERVVSSSRGISSYRFYSPVSG